jgi:choice-of-anchor A domain-containing protein
VRDVSLTRTESTLIRLFTRAAALTAAVTVFSATLVAAPAVSIAAAPSAAAAAALCTVDYGDYTNITNTTGPVVRFDGETNTYVGGDFLATTGSSEAEGVFVAEGDVTFDTHDYFNLGVVGVGSKVAPPAMSRMLTSGGNIDVASGTLDVGSGLGGNIESVGTAGPRTSIITSGGSIQENSATALAKYPEVANLYRTLSTEYAAMVPNGTVATDAISITFTGDDTAARQVFSVDGSDLGTAAQTKGLYFEDIPAGAIVVVNVTGARAEIGLDRLYVDGVWIDPFTTADNDFAEFTQSSMWNIPTAADVILGYRDQLPGSIMVPNPASTTTVLTSTNGRLYLAGDVVMGGSSTITGLELHAYPFREGPCATVAEGSLAINKTLTDPDGVVDPTRVYTGRYVCTDSAGVLAARGGWAATAGGAPFITPVVPALSVCTVTEDVPDAPSAVDASYLWRSSTVTPASTVVPDSTTPAVVTVHNEVRRAVGDLEMVKVLDDPYDVVDLGRFYSGSFSCLFNGADVTPPTRTWREQAGAAPVRLATGLPAGTVCTLAEDPILVPPLPGFPQYHWARPVISPSSVTIADNALARITVTNIVEDPFDLPATDVASETTPVVDPAVPPRATLAATGADRAGPLLVAGFMIAIGLVGLVARRVRRRLTRDRG